MKKLGGGAFGEIYKGKLSRQSICCPKKALWFGLQRKFWTSQSYASGGIAGDELPESPKREQSRYWFCVVEKRKTGEYLAAKVVSL